MNYDFFEQAIIIYIVSAFRAPGCPQGSFGLEMALDDLAQKLDIDPYELRSRNLSGTTYEVVPYEFQLGAERFGWKTKYQKHGSQPGCRQRSESDSVQRLVFDPPQ